MFFTGSEKYDVWSGLITRDVSILKGNTVSYSSLSIKHGADSLPVQTLLCECQIRTESQSDIGEQPESCRRFVST